jgi:3',5'-cyclic-AMP phosphodiesterase
MERREFIQRLTLGLAAGWVLGQLTIPAPALTAAPGLSLALLADAHLRDANDRRPEALALARAVAEIRALRPPPDLVLLAGDLAHKGRPDALDLGQEILRDLPAPVWAVPGEGDHGRHGAAAWVRRWGEPPFSRAFRGVHILGLNTALSPGPRSPVFELGPPQRHWLARELAALDPATPLVVLSHAPLARLFPPWQQWTADASEITPLLSCFRRVVCIHGHMHHAGYGGRRPEVRIIPPVPPLAQGGMAASPQSAKGGWFEPLPWIMGGSFQSPPLAKGDLGGFGGTWDNSNNFNSFVWLTANRKLQTENNLSLPATAWPCPQAVQGTPGNYRHGVGPHGCGWVMVTLGTFGVDFQPHLWQA